ncbi:hypothetical protein DERP_008609 [Dermatophagoides pteronyssinus]|uniref:Uncharacterized protein n=1 Tax=Dermatophagoides pteronyssinus TaxID=6956 RepID=A0ABQ8IWR5_DERPT|nr:hypothetical protein DERP_008609 [Dermatophagoides pteronyssinus]
MIVLRVTSSTHIPSSVILRRLLSSPTIKNGRFTIVVVADSESRPPGGRYSISIVLIKFRCVRGYAYLRSKPSLIPFPIPESSGDPESDPCESIIN